MARRARGASGRKEGIDPLRGKALARTETWQRGTKRACERQRYLGRVGPVVRPHMLPHPERPSHRAKHEHRILLDAVRSSRGAVGCREDSAVVKHGAFTLGKGAETVQKQRQIPHDRRYDPVDVWLVTRLFVCELVVACVVAVKE